MPPRAIVQCREQDPLVQVGCGARNRQRSEEAQHACAAADLGRAGRATLYVGRQARGIGGQEVIEQEQVDELAGACAVEDVRVRHIRYMT